MHWQCPHSSITQRCPAAGCFWFLSIEATSESSYTLRPATWLAADRIHMPAPSKASSCPKLPSSTSRLCDPHFLCFLCRPPSSSELLSPGLRSLSLSRSLLLDLRLRLWRWCLRDDPSLSLSDEDEELLLEEEELLEEDEEESCTVAGAVTVAGRGMVVLATCQFVQKIVCSRL